MSLLASGVVWWLLRGWKDRASFGNLFLMALLGVLSHLYLDWCTSWGTMLLWPLRKRFALDQLFIIDLWYAGLFAIPLVLSSFFKEQRARICQVGLLGVALYHGLAAYEHHHALKIAEGNRPQAWRAAFPQPLSPFRWMAFTRQDGLLWRAQVDFLKSSSPLSHDEWKEPAMTKDLQAAFQSPAAVTYLWFAKVPLWGAEPQKDGTTLVRFWDERFYVPFRGEDAPKRFGAVIRVKNGIVLSEDF